MKVGVILRESFSPLKNRDFRIYLGGQAISLVGTWLQLTAQGWVVWELSHSAAALGIVATLGSLPILLLGPWAGVWADRLDRRQLLIGLQAAAMILVFSLALLTQTGLVQLWHVYLLSLLLGVVTALDMPAQQAFLGDLSGLAEVRKAVNLNGMILHVSRMIGPVLAGLIIGALGVPFAFWLNGTSFLVVIASLWVVNAHQVRKPHSGHVLEEFREGLRFVARQPRVQDLLIFVILMTFFGLPVLNILPAVVGEILQGDAETLGWLMAASGAGALVGMVVVTPLAQTLRRTGVVVGSAVLWMGIWFMIFSGAVWLPLSFLSMFMLSLGGPVIMATSIGLLQALAPPDMRARLLSLFVMVSFGMQPLASLLTGYSAELLGTPTAIALNGLFLITGALLLLAVRPKLRHWETHPQLAAAPEAG